MGRRYHARHAVGFERRVRHRRGILITLGLLVAALIAALLLEPLFVRLERVELAAADLPADIRQLKVVYLSDIHYGFFYGRNRLSELVSQVNALNPDLILLGGDYSTDTAGAAAFFRTFPDFHARYGIFAVLGEHEYDGTEEEMRQLRYSMMAAGVTALVSESAQVRIGSSSIWIVGADDVTREKPKVAISDLARRVRSTDYVIFLCHSPAGIAEALRCDSADGQRKWFDLGLFGHTHGGQIPFFGQFMGFNDVPSRYMTGWRQENRIDLLVSNGIGTSVLPIRLMTPPQLHLITLRRN